VGMPHGMEDGRVDGELDEEELEALELTLDDLLHMLETGTPARLARREPRRIRRRRKKREREAAEQAGLPQRPV
jgi:hypothetical protein